MPWLRIGDNASTHPRMFRLLEVCDFDHDFKNQCFGTLVLAASIAAAHLQDYIVAPGMIATFAPTRTKEIVQALVDAELLERVKIDEQHMLKILDDEDFIHMRTKEEVEQDRNRAADKRKPGLIIAVRVRDGDACRWCGRTVSWTDRVGTRGGTYDSLTNHQDSDVDNLVVACKGCNSRRREGVELKLRAVPSPEEIYYSPSTISWINNHPYALEHGIAVSDRQTRLDLTPTRQAARDDNDQAAAPQAADPTTSGAAAPGVAAPARVDEAPGTTAPEGTGKPECNETVKPGSRPRSDPGREGDGPRIVGTGRDGSVGDGAGERSVSGKERGRRRGRRSGRRR